MIRVQWFVCDRGVIHVRTAYVINYYGRWIVLQVRPVEPRRQARHEFRTRTLDKWRAQAAKADLN